MDKAKSLAVSTNWKPRVLVIGAVIGAIIGLGAAYLLTQRAADENTPPELSAGDGVKLGLLVLGLLRQVAELGAEKR